MFEKRVLNYRKVGENFNQRGGSWKFKCAHVNISKVLSIRTKIFSPNRKTQWFWSFALLF